MHLEASNQKFLQIFFHFSIILLSYQKVVLIQKFKFNFFSFRRLDESHTKNVSRQIVGPQQFSTNLCTEHFHGVQRILIPLIKLRPPKVSFDFLFLQFF